MAAKAQRERQRLEEENFKHQRERAKQQADMRDKARATSVPTASRAMWDSHLQALENLKIRSAGSVGESDIPWPPAHNIAFFTPSDGFIEKKKKVMKATLSWHPDKFQQKYGSLLKEEETPKILERVAALSSQFIELRQVLNDQYYR